MEANSIICNNDIGIATIHKEDHDKIVKPA